ncbi:MAG TPA: DNA polymerase I [Rhizomicrobium sp.]
MTAKKAARRALAKGDHLTLVDGSGYLFRAYHALPPLTRKSDGLPTNAVSGFCNMLWKFLEDSKGPERPTHLAVIFDAGKTTFRNAIYPQYKAHRPDPPEDLIPQFPLVRDATRAFGVACTEVAGFEADDLLATYARMAREIGARVTIVSSDKDLMQLVEDGKVELFDPVKNKRLGSAEVIERFGVPPNKVVEVQALAGDSTDNVPGVRGIGGDTASWLIRKADSLDQLLKLSASGKFEKQCEIELAEIQKRLDKIAGEPVKFNSGKQLGTILFEKWKLPGGKKDKKGEWTIDVEILDSLANSGNKFCQDIKEARRLSKAPSYSELLNKSSESATVSLKLVTLDANAKIACPMDEMLACDPDPATLIAFLKAMEFNTLTRRAASHFNIADPDAIAAAPDPAQAALPAPGDATPLKKLAPLAADHALVAAGNVPGAVANRDAILKPINHDAYETVTTLARLDHWIARAREMGIVCVDTETTSLDAMQAGLCGVSLAVAPNEACYIPCGHTGGAGLDLSNHAKVAQLSEKDVLARLKPLLEDDSVLKVAQNLKYDYLIFLQRGIRITPFDDTMLMSYVLEATLHGHGMDELSQMHLSHTPIAFSEVAGKGKEKITFDCVPIKEATRYSAEDADVTLRLHALLKPRLIAEGKRSVYETLERPLVPVLVDMERNGIAIDSDLLRRLSNDFAQSQAKLEKQIHKLADQEFNIGSPKQLGDILFGKFALPGGRKTKTGAWSTDVDVLEEVAAQGHEIARKVLDWRQLAKLRGTYTDALPTYVNPQTHRVHTSFAMASTSTGRLASTDPNLQNIPIRTEEGRRIRTAFVAPKGALLVSADYSQIELRLLAHIADIPALRQAFSDGTDIHAMTASEIFGVPVKGMPADVRRKAKAINFGIIYGISAFGLANQLSIARGEADDYIKKYFQRFPGIRDYMENTKAFAREHGYVETLFGRRVHIREIRSSHQGHRGGAERAAINAPIQGSAADIIRRAMIRVPEALAKNKLKAKMLLQVHDELVFEVPEKEAEKTCAVVSKVMEKASLPALELSVPLTVEARAAANWDAAH